MRAGRFIGWAVALAIAIGMVPPPPAADAQANGRVRVFNAPIDRVWTVARSTLKGLGWDIDKEEREGGWIRTDSRRLEGDDFGVYAKGTRQRLRLVLKSVAPDRTQVTVERRVYRHERILWMEKEEDLPLQDQQAEQKLLDDIAAAL